MPHDQNDADLCGIPVVQILSLAHGPPVAPTKLDPDDDPAPTPRGRPWMPARLDPESRRRIGRNLRLLYGDVLNQPLPARFEALLAELSTRDETGGAA